MTDGQDYGCPIEATLELIGGKYKPRILWHLKDGVLRFNELRRMIPDATTKMMTQHLRELERDGLINRRVYPVVPPRVEYSLSPYGKTILPVMTAMCDWGMAHRKKTSRKKSVPCRKAV